MLMRENEDAFIEAQFDVEFGGKYNESVWSNEMDELKRGQINSQMNIKNFHKYCMNILTKKQS